jgi:YfiH family protein
MGDREIIPPDPRPSFAWAHRSGRMALVCSPLESIAHHCFTTTSWRLDGSDDDEAWEEVGEAVGTPPARVIRARQVHGTDLLLQPAGSAPIAGAPADILATADATFALAVRTADCVPLLIADRRTGVVAAAHAGWRGTALRAGVAAVDAMRTRFGSDPGDLVAAIGPAIGPCCYEVGADVRERFAREHFTERELSRWFSTQPLRSASNPPMDRAAGAPPGGWYLNLWTATRDQLESAGVPADQIFAADLCTASHPRTFCSYRRDGKRAGRLAAVIRRRGSGRV